MADCAYLWNERNIEVSNYVYVSVGEIATSALSETTMHRLDLFRGKAIGNSLKELLCLSKI